MLQFGNRAARAVYTVGASKNVPEYVAAKAARQFDILAAAKTLEDARFAGHGRMSKRPGSKPARYCLHVIDRWWISFHWALYNAVDVRLEQV
jgi:plasmid maintenance system killer protein